MKRITVKIDFLSSGIVYCYDCTCEEFCDYMEIEQRNMSGLTVSKYGSFPHIYVFENDIGTIAHECLHAIFNIALYFGIKYDKSSEEWFTHTMGYLMSEILKKMK